MTEPYHNPREPSAETLALIRERYALNNDGVLIARIKYHHAAPGVGQPVGYVCSAGFLKTRLKNKRYKVSHITFYLCTGHWPKQPLEHVDGDKMNCKPSNIQYTTMPEVSRRRARYSSCCSGVAGVDYRPRKDRWRARIRLGGQRDHLGEFRTLDEAAAVRQKASQEYNFDPKHGRVT